MDDELTKIHDAVSRCRLCVGILDEHRIIPRSGFPPAGKYTALVVGCEPGQAAEGRPTPEQCMLHGRPCIVVTHPQKATSAYLAAVAQHVRKKLSPNEGVHDGAWPS
jgi:hypothetical protein